MNDAPLLAARGLEKSFRTGFGKPPLRAVQDVSIRIGHGETVALVGESGSGKSTLGRLLNRLIEADAGQIELEGQDVRQLRGAERRRLRQRVQMVFQDPMASLNPRHRIEQTMVRPQLLHGVAANRAEARVRAIDLLAEVGIGAEALGRFPHEFSGGQRQRIGIARALTVGPDLLICDEPVSALDVSVQAQIVNLLERLKTSRNLAQLFIAHDLALVRRISDRLLVIYRGRVVEEGPTEAVFSCPAHPYTRALLEAVPRIGHAAEPPEPAPDRTVLGNGCNYCALCPVAEKICDTTSPPLTDTGSGAKVACHFPQLEPLALAANHGAQTRARRIAAFAEAAGKND